MASRIGIITGSFEPFHIGHLSIGFYARSKYDMDYILFVPVLEGPGRRPHRRTTPVEKLDIMQQAVCAALPQASAAMTARTLQDALNYVQTLSFYDDSTHSLNDPDKEFFLFVSRKLTPEQLGVTLPKNMTIVPFPRPIAPCSSTMLREALASDDPDAHSNALEWLPRYVREYYATTPVYKEV